MSKVLPIILVLILSIFTWKTLLHKGYFSMHDDQQIVRLQQLDKSLQSGQFPVRWVEDLGFGYGYPLFNFYPPLVYYLGEAFHLVGFGFVDSIKLVWFTAFIGSALTMFLLTKNILSSIFYLYAPYHAVDAYVRGALAELFSFVWLPLILHFSSKPIISGIFLALLMLTHNLIFLPFVGIYILWSRNIKNIIISLVIAFGLTSFFWMPALYEKQFTLVDQLLIKNLASYKIHFLCPQQLWYSQWGFGGSTAGCIDGLSFSLGKVFILTIAIGLIFSAYKRSKIGLTSFCLLVLSLFMTLSYSQFIWDRIPQLWYLQFSWRFLEFVVLFGAIIAGQIKTKIIALILIILIIFVNAKYFQPQKYLPNATDTQMTSEETIKWDISSTSFEYLPAGIATKINELGAVWVDINKSQIRNSKLEIRNGEIIQQEFLPDKFKLEGNFKENAQVQFNITNFPGWKAWVDGEEAVIDDNNKFKLITISVPVGSHKITGKFTNTPVRTLGNLVSVLSISLLVAGIVKSTKLIESLDKEYNKNNHE